MYRSVEDEDEEEEEEEEEEEAINEESGITKHSGGEMDWKIARYIIFT